MSISGIGSQSGFDPTQMAAQFFKKADANGDGGIDKAEFKTILSRGPGGQTGTMDTDKIFSEIDADGNGTISQAENENAMKKMGVRGGAPPSGPPPGGMGGGGTQKSGTTGDFSSSSGTYDVKDANKDGTVSLRRSWPMPLSIPAVEAIMMIRVPQSRPFLKKCRKGSNTTRREAKVSMRTRQKAYCSTFIHKIPDARY